MIGTFTVIDFETANGYRDSACSLGLVRVVDGVIKEVKEWLIKPVGEFSFQNINIHGIEQSDVKDAPYWDELWPEIKHYFNGLMVAHNMSFDKSVLNRTCEYYDIKPPKIETSCTYKLAKEILPNLPNHKLPTVCERLQVELKNHHSAVEDSLAAAKVFLKIQTIAKEPVLLLGKGATKKPRRTISKCVRTDNVLSAGEFDVVEDLDFEWEGLVVVLSGEFLYGSKKKVEKFFLDREAVISKSVTKKVDIVILGQCGSDKYKNNNYGLKVEKGLALREKFGRPMLFTEESFFNKYNEED